MIMINLSGKTAVVTGSSRGIGRASALALAQAGAQVLVHYSANEKEAEAVVGEIRKSGGKADKVRADLSKADGAHTLAKQVRVIIGNRLDILVANAGIGLMVPSIVDMTLADWRRQTAVNLDGVFLSVKYAVPAMRRAGGGSIIIMSSTAGLRGSAGLAGYCATKGGVRLFAKAVAMECSAEDDGIRVNTVHPGVIDTPIWTKIAGSTGRNLPIDPNEVAKAGVPLGRVGQAQDIANGVLFLASDASNYMTGAELVIDGGMTGGARPRWS
jgi:NAD(P)-dependent dehydrogenase (short-subunit alcohol dehydrogenase family)